MSEPEHRRRKRPDRPGRNNIAGKVRKKLAILLTAGYIYNDEVLSTGGLTVISNNKPDKKAMLLGVGFDNADGQKRITRGDNFCLVGGSEETHERMTETTIKFNEKLARKGKHLEELSREEFRDMLHDL